MSWGGDANVVSVTERLLRAGHRQALPQQQAPGASQRLFPTLTLRTREVRCSDKVTQENLYQREERGLKSASLFTHHEDSKLLSVQRSHSLQGRGRNQPTDCKSSEAPSIWRLWDPGIPSSICTTLKGHQLTLQVRWGLEFSFHP